MTDNEIIKAYGCCNLSIDECGGCDNCPCKIEGECIVPSGFDLEREVFNLLNRQKAEIERYLHSIKLLEKDVTGAKEDAAKTFSKFLIDRSEGGSIEIQNLPDLTFAYINGERKNE